MLEGAPTAVIASFLIVYGYFKNLNKLFISSGLKLGGPLCIIFGVKINFKSSLMRIWASVPLSLLKLPCFLTNDKF